MGCTICAAGGGAWKGGYSPKKLGHTMQFSRHKPYLFPRFCYRIVHQIDVGRNNIRCTVRFNIVGLTEVVELDLDSERKREKLNIFLRCKFNSRSQK